MSKAKRQTQEQVRRVLALLRTERMEMHQAQQATRHPRVQRESAEKRWSKRCFGGFFNPQLAAVQPIRAVVAPQHGKFKLWLLDGGHRIEACIKSPEFGPKTMLPFTVYGPYDDSPKDADCAALLDAVASGRHEVPVSVLTQFTWARLAGDAVAQETQRQLNRLPRCQAVAMPWGIAKRSGADRLREVVDFLIGVWGSDVDPQAVILNTLERTNLTALYRRRVAVRKHLPADWVARGKLAMLSTDGVRSPLTHYIRGKLFGIGYAVGGSEPNPRR